MVKSCSIRCREAVTVNGCYPGAVMTLIGYDYSGDKNRPMIVAFCNFLGMELNRCRTLRIYKIAQCFLSVHVLSKTMQNYIKYGTVLRVGIISYLPLSIRNSFKNN